jgi:glycine dehydrogenase subunit 1
MSFGGPYCGVIACKEKFLRQMPGRIVGETKDVNGKRGFVLTLSTREQHIRREKATSNICTNQALVAMMVTIFLTVYGKEGLRELADHNLAKAAYLKGVLAGNSGSGAKVLFDGAPRFHEFVLELPSDAAETNEALLTRKIIGGLPLNKWYPELGPNASLWCATELTTRGQMDAAADALRAVAPAAETARV